MHDEKTSFVSQDQALLVAQTTPANYIYERPAKGGGTWKYVTGNYVKSRLNLVFGFNWDFEVVSHEIIQKSVVVLGKLTVRDGKGQAVSKMQFGRADIKFKRNSQDMLDIGNDMKAAATDALKKCASELGIAGDIYGQNEQLQIKTEYVEVERDAEATVQKVVDNAKDEKTLDAIKERILTGDNFREMTEEEKMPLLAIVEQKRHVITTK